ncbi:MAG TPA: anaerobic ribonucleoside-triphosphate reductase activating protein [Termitinemataceae bacterium]|nr:anaerobic ribonucleoside-triphosphate reductase activating protein [Termitinemataceae bacterium]HOM22774.1 anaerobic ribonucleoside-triphosphate reductase activating protein [Termitinemataceae bacterium]HPQ00684.1 anaerobic ribonucleoside-triphosphate reductase activating protein [Termitinemataceae bacterium]
MATPLPSWTQSTKVGLRKLSLVDYPGKLAAVIFFRGCNFRCPWCHNPELVLLSQQNEGEWIHLEEALAILEARQNRVPAVVITGGEPTLFPQLPELVMLLKEKGFFVKLDTNGSRPEVLKKLLSAPLDTRPDYVAVDLKIGLSRYREVRPLATRSEGGTKTTSPEDIPFFLRESCEIVQASGVAHEFRTVILPEGFTTEGDIEELAPLVGNSPWYFTPFRGGHCLDPHWEGTTDTTSEQVQKLANLAQSLGKDIRLRGLGA